MKNLLVAAGLLLAASALHAASPLAERIDTDGAVLDRVAELSKRDLPDGLLKRMLDEDVELMRGLRPDGTYEFATWERFEAGRKTESYSVPPSEEVMATLEISGAFVYRLVIEVPDRRYLVRKNLPVWIERVDVEYVGETNRNERTSFEIRAWQQPGEIRPVDLPVVARQATVKVVATSDPKGTASLVLALVEARIVDLASSPWAASVAAAKSALRALDGRDLNALRESARRMREGVASQLEPPPPPVVPQVRLEPAPRPEPAYRPPDSAEKVELQAELQLIEDLLTGTETERREGMDRLHQLIRQIR